MSCTYLLSRSNYTSPAFYGSITRRSRNYAVAQTSFLNKDERAPNFVRTPWIHEKRGSDIIVVEKKFTVRASARVPLVLSSGKESKLYDVEERECIDLTSGIGVNAVGHGDSDWVCVDRSGAFRSESNIYYSVRQVELVNRLAASSFADRVFFCNPGTEAKEAAIKILRQFQIFSHPDEKDTPDEFIAYTNSFHGKTMGAVALTSKEHYRAAFEPVMPVVTFLDYGNTQATVELINSRKFAAVFVKPIQGENGIYSTMKEFLQSLRTACDNAGCLLVYDEVQCGFNLWAHEAYGVYPDIMTVAKLLAGGLTIGAVLMTKRVASAINFGDHGSTFAGNPLVCSAGIAVPNKILNPSFLDSVEGKAQYFNDLLVEKLGENSHVKVIRGFGLNFGIELDVSASRLVDACEQSNLLLLTAGKGNIVRIVLPLNISKQLLDQAVETLKNCFPVLDQATNN